MAKTGITITKNKHILDNLGVLNQNMNHMLGRVVDPPLKKYMRSYMQTTSGMKKYPGSVVKPIDWQTPAQKRWAGWALGQGILPSRRSGELFRHFDVTSDRRALETAIVNTYEFAKYIIGKFQQRFHKATGYRTMESYEPEALKGAIPVASNALESEMFRFLTKRGLI